MLGVEAIGLTGLVAAAGLLMVVVWLRIVGLVGSLLYESVHPSVRIASTLIPSFLFIS